MAEELKKCPYCHMDIPSESIKCGYCREWLNKTRLSWKNPFIYMPLLLLFFFGFLQVMKKSILNITPIDFHRYSSKSSKLQIINHRLIKDSDGFYIMGEIQNNEDFKWSSVTVSAVFLTKDNESINIGTAYIHNLEPMSKKAFKVDFSCSDAKFNPKTHDHYEIQIEDGY